jgi:2-dehydro-3-deoxyphosphogluconate aldolase/(4S)-4-hydroxy-2-oxoglutarate aldolase
LQKELNPMEYLNESQLEQRLREIAVIPVAALQEMETVVDIANALCAGGLPAIEVTFRTAIAADAIAAIKQNCPQMLVAAGTVLTAEQVNAAADAGADFLVSPGCNLHTLQAAKARNIPMIPGICTPTEAEMALQQGLKLVKFFPAEAAGGLAMLRAMSAPYAMLRFMPTGGISLENLGEYLAFPKVVACGGSFMLSAKMLQARDYAAITAASAKAAAIAKQSRGGI